MAWYVFEVKKKDDFGAEYFKLLCLTDDVLEEGYTHLQNNMFQEYIRHGRSYKGYIPNIEELRKVVLDRGRFSPVTIRRAKTEEDIKNIVVSRQKVKRNYEIINMEKIHGCEACVLGSMKQADHMECPYGCLHTPEDCFLCFDITSVPYEDAKKIVQDTDKKLS